MQEFHITVNKGNVMHYNFCIYVLIMHVCFRIAVLVIAVITIKHKKNSALLAKNQS